MPAIGEQPGKHTQSTEDLLPIGDAARLLGVSVETLRRWDRGGRIPSVRTLGGQRRFRHGDIDRLVSWGRPGTDEAPKYYIASSMWQLAMHPEAARVRLAVLFGRPFTMREYVIERDDELCGALIDHCRAFRATVVSGVMPPLDDSVATYEAVRAQHPDIDRDLDVQITEAQPPSCSTRWARPAAPCATARSSPAANPTHPGPSRSCESRPYPNPPLTKETPHDHHADRHRPAR